MMEKKVSQNDMVFLCRNIIFNEKFMAKCLFSKIISNFLDNFSIVYCDLYMTFFYLDSMAHHLMLFKIDSPLPLRSSNIWIFKYFIRCITGCCWIMLQAILFSRNTTNSWPVMEDTCVGGSVWEVGYLTGSFWFSRKFNSFYFQYILSWHAVISEKWIVFYLEMV